MGNVRSPLPRRRMASLCGRLAPLPATDHRLPKTATVTPFHNSNPLINEFSAQIQVFWIIPDLNDQTIWGRLDYGFKVTIKQQENNKCCLEADLFVLSGPNVVLHPKIPFDKVLIVIHEMEHVAAINNRIKEIESLIISEIECYASEEESSQAARNLEIYYMNKIITTQAAESKHDMTGGYGTPPPGFGPL